MARFVDSTVAARRDGSIEHHRRRRLALDGRIQITLGLRAQIGHTHRYRTHQMRSKSQAAWETAARCATLTEETDDPNEREYYARLRDAWITLAKRREFSSISDVTDSENISDVTDSEKF
jgi:hypothetical protein